MRLVGVTKSFGTKVVLSDTSIDLAAGRVHVLSGPSGTGKSTVLNLLAGYTACDSGRVEAPARVGYLFQESLLFSNLTVEENLQIRRIAEGPVSVNADADAMVRVLDRLGITHLRTTLVAHLSGGERQRVELAGLLLLDPALVLMDEPTSSLDPRTRDEVVSLICSIFPETTTLIVSHDPAVAGLIPDAIRLRLADGKLRHG